MDEVWAKIIPPHCPNCGAVFPRLLTLKVSTEWNFDLYLECGICLYEMHWKFGLDTLNDQFINELTALQDERYGDDVGDFASWEDSLETENDPEAGIQLELPCTDWWYL